MRCILVFLDVGTFQVVGSFVFLIFELSYRYET